MKTIPFKEIKNNTLFVLPGAGVCRKIHPCQATAKDGKVRVIYPDDKVSELKKREPRKK